MLMMRKESTINMSQTESSYFKVLENHPNDSRVKFADTVQTLNTRMGTGGGNVPMLLKVFRKGAHPRNSEEGQTYMETDVVDTLNVFDNTEARTPTLVNVDTIVRRLTPLECERLDGFPDFWTDIGEWVDSKGKKRTSADSLRYKALGNSIALPWWDRMISRLCAYYDRPVEMASLFDGISGFPLCFSRHGGVPVWSSEIDEFAIAVAKKHFPEETKDD